MLFFCVGFCNGDRAGSENVKGIIFTSRRKDKGDMVHDFTWMKSGYFL